MTILLKYKVCASFPVPPSAKLLYCYLLDTADYKNTVVKSYRSIAQGVGLSRGTVCRNLHRLKRHGLLEIKPRRTEDGGKLANCYTII